MDKPIKNSYCVIEGSVYAGEYAGDLHNPREKMAQFEQFGITHFIDLTVDGELHPYEPIMPEGCVHHRFPIHDVSTPSSVEDVYELLKYIDSLAKEVYNKVYIHCWGGVGRTGTIVACYYEYLGESYDSAVKHLRDSFKQCPKSKYRNTPDTNEQLNFIKEFGDYMDYIRTKEEKERQKDEVQYTPDNIEALQSNEIFVFGSNLDGQHQGGAAHVAYKKFGAVWGKGVGIQGQSYAIPTMKGGVELIKLYVNDFIDYARNHPDLKFYVTRIGCGIAGFKDDEIAPLFADAIGMGNIILPKSFVEIIQPEFPFEPAAIEAVMNWMLPGLQLFYRDTDYKGNLDSLAKSYMDKGIIRAGFFVDCTSRAAKPTKRLRFIIASAHAAEIWKVMNDREAEQWRLTVLDFNSYFKVMDTYRVGDQLQILLLHIPLRGIPLVAGLGNINLGENFDLIRIARNSFDEKSKMEPFPWLETEAWTERMELLPGTSSEGWTTLEFQYPYSDEVAKLQSGILNLSNDDTDLNKPTTT